MGHGVFGILGKGQYILANGSKTLISFVAFSTKSLGCLAFLAVNLFNKLQHIFKTFQVPIHTDQTEYDIY